MHWPASSLTGKLARGPDPDLRAVHPAGSGSRPDERFTGTVLLTGAVLRGAPRAIADDTEMK
jgi:hypothetical protein